jgi:hypothetical protein
MQPTPQDNQLMSKHRVLSFKPQLRLEWRGQDSQNETEQPDHSASLGDSITASTQIRFSVHTPRRTTVDARNQPADKRMINRRLKPHRRPCAHFWSGTKSCGGPPGREESVAPAVDNGHKRRFHHGINSDKVFGTYRSRKNKADAVEATPAPPNLGTGTPLRIPYGNKEVALKLGARYRTGGWYAPPGVDLSAFGERGWL